MIWKELNKNDVLLYKGIAILMIVIHNFLHRFPLPKENEMTFDPIRVQDFLSIIINEPGGSVRAIFSFFGHFGVQIFVFLSAYGLSKKYTTHSDKYFTFLITRVSKLYPSFCLAIIAYIFYGGLVQSFYLGTGFDGFLVFLENSFQSILLKLSLLSNFVPGEGFALVGPWWFMSLIFQFYIFFPLLLRLKNEYGTAALVFLSLFSLFIMVLSRGEIFGVSVFFLLVGHLPVLCLGMYFAQKKTVKMSNVLLLISIVLYSLGNFYKEFWLVSHINFLIILLFVLHIVTPIINRFKAVNKLLTFFGVISLPLFLLNGFLRAPWIQFAQEKNDELITLLLCMVFLLISTFSAYIFIKVEHYTKKLLPKF
jgi:peptidoglycan/LPS O-acetylase OafA/YrhL